MSNVLWLMSNSIFFVLVSRLGESVVTVTFILAVNSLFSSHVANKVGYYRKCANVANVYQCQTMSNFYLLLTRLEESIVTVTFCFLWL